MIKSDVSFIQPWQIMLWVSFRIIKTKNFWKKSRNYGDLRRLNKRMWNGSFRSTWGIYQEDLALFREKYTDLSGNCVHEEGRVGYRWPQKVHISKNSCIPISSRREKGLGLPERKKIIWKSSICSSSCFYCPFAMDMSMTYGQCLCQPIAVSWLN